MGAGNEPRHNRDLNATRRDRRMVRATGAAATDQSEEAGTPEEKRLRRIGRQAFIGPPSQGALSAAPRVNRQRS